MFYGSSYDRGLDILLGLYPQVIHKFPDTTLHIAYGWNLYDVAFNNNPERMAWKEKINNLMKQKGITHHGRISKEELKKVRLQCGIWAYPTYFTEINCITALECQRDGVVPCTMNFGALTETVQSGIKVDGDISDQETKDKWLNSLFTLMSDEKLWKDNQAEGNKFANRFTWDRIAHLWISAF